LLFPSVAVQVTVWSFLSTKLHWRTLLIATVVQLSEVLERLIENWHRQKLPTALTLIAVKVLSS
jgi:hypothetical protein